MRPETRTGILVVAESGSKGHRKVRHILMIPRTIRVSRHRRVMTRDHGEGAKERGETRETTPEKQSSYKVDALFDTFGSVDAFRTYVRTRSYGNLKTKYSFYQCKYRELSSGAIAVHSFQRSYPSLYF